MRKYNFQYTKLLETIFFIIGICVFVFLLVYIFVWLKLSLFWMYFVAPISGIGIFLLLRKNVMHIGESEISDDSVILKLSNRNYKINFEDLISYKKANYKNGPVLYLKNNTIKLRLEANNHFCNSDDFEKFTDDLISVIEVNKKNAS